MNFNTEWNSFPGGIKSEVKVFGGISICGVIKFIIKRTINKIKRASKILNYDLKN